MCKMLHYNILAKLSQIYFLTLCYHNSFMKLMLWKLWVNEWSEGRVICGKWKFEIYLCTQLCIRKWEYLGRFYMSFSHLTLKLTITYLTSEWRKLTIFIMLSWAELRRAEPRWAELRGTAPNRATRGDRVLSLIQQLRAKPLGRSGPSDKRAARLALTFKWPFISVSNVKRWFS